MEREYTPRQLTSIVSGEYMPRERALAQQCLRLMSRDTASSEENGKLREGIRQVREFLLSPRKTSTRYGHYVNRVIVEFDRDDRDKLIDALAELVSEEPAKEDE